MSEAYKHSLYKAIEVHNRLVKELGVRPLWELTFALTRCEAEVKLVDLERLPLQRGRENSGQQRNALKQFLAASDKYEENDRLRSLQTLVMASKSTGLHFESLRSIQGS